MHLAYVYAERTRERRERDPTCLETHSKTPTNLDLKDCGLLCAEVRLPWGRFGVWVDGVRDGVGVRTGGLATSISFRYFLLFALVSKMFSYFLLFVVAFRYVL